MNRYYCLALIIALQVSCQNSEEETQTATDYENENAVMYLRQPIEGSSFVPTNAIPGIRFERDYFFGDFNESGEFVLDQLIQSVSLKNDGTPVEFDTDYINEKGDNIIFMIPKDELKSGFYEVEAKSPITSKPYKWSFYVGSYPYLRGVSADTDESGNASEVTVVFSEKIESIAPGDICIGDVCNTNSCSECLGIVLEMETFTIGDDIKKLRVSSALTSMDGTKLKKSEARVLADYDQIAYNDGYYVLSISKANDICEFDGLYCWGR
jgi:hypothetical protein